MIPWKRERLTHSSILAWRIAWTEDPGRLSSRGHKERLSLSVHFQLRRGLEPMGLGLEHSQNPVFHLRSQHPVSGPNKAQVLDVSSQKEFIERQNDR